MASGIEVRHRAGCTVKPNGSGCTCTPTFRAVVFDKTADSGKGRKITKSFPSEAAARNWRRDAYRALGQGDRQIAVERLTLRQACELWLEEAARGVVTTRSGDRYKPGALRSYRQSLDLRVWDELGDRPFHSIKRLHLQDLVDRLVAEGHAPATVQGAITALRVVYRRALQRGEIEVLPTQGLKLPAVRSRRERFASPAEAEALIAAAPEQHRAVWATAFYTGMRRGELLALRWEDVDLQAGTIDVVASWDPEHGRQETKNRQRRTVPVPRQLREHLATHRLRQAPGAALVFPGEQGDRPLSPSRLQEAADEAWKTAKLNRITPHECRHTYASLMIAAGVNAKALCDYMGHSSITVTYDRYGHLMPGAHDEAAQLLDSYLSRASGS